MAGKVIPIPTGFHTVTTYRTPSNCADAISFHKKALSAQKVMRMEALVYPQFGNQPLLQRAGFLSIPGRQRLRIGA